MRLPNWLAPVLLGLSVILGWLIFTTTGIIAPYLLPHPGAVLANLIHGLTAGYLLDSLVQTNIEAGIGAGFAAIIGVPLGLAIAHWKIFSASIEPYLAASQAIPAVAIAPLLVTWIGYGIAPIITLCAIIVVFPIVISTGVGIRSIDSDVIAAARLDGAGGINLLTRIEIPLAAPNILAGFRNGFTLAITGAVVGEMIIGGQKGLGIMLITAQHLHDLPAMFATIILLAITAVFIYLILRAIEMKVVQIVSV
ncbi:ABC transporter permease [Arcanobacterium hippocoleae]|uniref:NitT/TauT family transport system permease protein n=1 Tax=Arcanobacterium hippocoleae TaxID=149017 RepID=A0ABU1T061_9ACTO|nr:ABC transporter permease [Arcanobacterium hippocoleae]MDR6938767.1 NitT/TauT family transport system permease protein [Arcanobacterium hippocoleae]